MHKHKIRTKNKVELLRWAPAFSLREWRWGGAPLPNPVFSRWCPSKKSIYRGGSFLGGGGALFRSSLWFIGIWVIEEVNFVALPTSSSAMMSRSSRALTRATGSLLLSSSSRRSLLAEPLRHTTGGSQFQEVSEDRVQLRLHEKYLAEASAWPHH